MRALREAGNIVGMHILSMLIRRCVPGTVWLFALFGMSPVVAMPVKAPQAKPQLRCEVTYAGQTEVFTAQPVSDPYTVQAVSVGERFFFKMVMVNRNAQLDRIMLYAYLDQEPRPVMVQASQYSAPFRVTAQPYLLTGEQRLYAGPVERELIYRCWLGGVKP